MKTEIEKQRVVDSMETELARVNEEKEALESKKTVVNNNSTTTQNTSTKKKGWSNTAKGAVIGAGVGAATGAIVSKKKGQGAIIGGLVGAGVGGYAGDAIDNAMRVQESCRQIQTYEPVSGGYQIVYELDGQQYTVRSSTFPRGKTIAVQMHPVPLPQQ